MTKKVHIFLALMLLLGVAGFVAAETVTLPNPLCPNPNDAANCVTSLPQLIVRITDYILTIVGVLATFVFIWAGILFITSAGNPGRIEDAKKALIYAIIGVVITVVGKGLVEVIQSVITAP